MRRKKATVPVPALLLLAAAAGLGAWWLVRSNGEQRPAGEPEATRVAPAAGAPMAPLGSRQAPAAAGARPPADLPPLPRVAFPAARPAELVLAAYEFAARRPDVMEYVPCFCGCEHEGHATNADCFVASRDAAGRVTWDAHGIG